MGNRERVTIDSPPRRVWYRAMFLRQRPGFEVTAVYVVVCGVTAALTLLQTTSLGDYLGLMVGALFLFTAIRLAQREPNGLARFGIRLGGLLAPAERQSGDFLGLRELLSTLKGAAPSGLRETAHALLLGLVFFPPFVLAYQFWNDPQGPFVFQWPDDTAALLLSQLLVTALPEEAFFRGYVQTRLGDRFKGRMRVLGADLSIWALLISSSMFAAIHIFKDQNPAHLAVFFPGLVFGWIRERRGGIGAAVVFHALCNLLAEILRLGWLH